MGEIYHPTLHDWLLRPVQYGVVMKANNGRDLLRCLGELILFMRLDNVFKDLVFSVVGSCI